MAQNLEHFLQDTLGATVFDGQVLTPAGTILERTKDAAARCSAGMFWFTKEDGGLVFTQASAEALDETALKVKNGELSAEDAWSTTLALAFLLDAMDGVIAEVDPPDALAGPCALAVAVHEQVKGILARWFRKEIDHAQTRTELEPVLTQIGAIAQSAERTLATRYGIAQAELTAYRQEAVGSLKQITEPSE